MEMAGWSVEAVAAAPAGARMLPPWRNKDGGRDGINLFRHGNPAKVTGRPVLPRSSGSSCLIR